MSDADEQDLEGLRRAAAGDRDGFDALVARHQAAVYRFIRTLGPDAGHAEDVLQETFLSAWRAAGTFRGDSTVRTWLLTIARHAAYRQARRRQGEPEPADEVPLDTLALAAGWGSAPTPEDAVLQREATDRLRRALAALPEEDQRVLVLRDLEELDGDTAAAVLGIGLAALKSRLHRARLRLAAKVREEEGHAG